ncbi:MAG: hypothetical protein D6826_10355, partial [Alphaproteobacteria bacterium]
MLLSLAIQYPAAAGQFRTESFLAPAARSDAGSPRTAAPLESQTATAPVGTIRLRVIPRVGAGALRDPI